MNQNIQSFTHYTQANKELGTIGLLFNYQCENMLSIAMTTIARNDQAI
jgi:hypothetical protein